MASVKFYKNDIAYPKVLADKLNKLADTPDAMEFKGSLGVGGTITALPVDGSAKKGDTYKVITDGTYAGQTAKVGDLFICNEKTSSSNTWVLIPSGDEPSGTVTSVKIEANAPISVNDSTPITSSGTRTISHNTSGVGAGSYGPTADVVGTDNTTIKVPQITVDSYGHITGVAERTYTSKDTDTKVTSAANHYGYASGSGKASGLYKVATDDAGHVTETTAVDKADITALGIPGSDTNTHRPIQVDGTEVLGDNVTPLNLSGGTNISLSDDGSGKVTIDANIPKTEHELIYFSEDNVGKNEYDGLFTQQLMYDDGIVVDNETDFNYCKEHYEYSDNKVGMQAIIGGWTRGYVDNMTSIPKEDWQYKKDTDSIDANRNDNYGNYWADMSNSYYYLKNIADIGFYSGDLHNDGIGIIFQRQFKIGNDNYVDKIYLDCGNRYKNHAHHTMSLNISRVKRSESTDSGTIVKSLSISTAPENMTSATTAGGYVSIISGTDIVPIAATSSKETYLTRVETTKNNKVITFHFSNAFDISTRNTVEHPINYDRYIKIDLQNRKLTIKKQGENATTYNISTTPRVYDSNGNLTNNYLTAPNTQWVNGVDFTDVLNSLAEEAHFGYWQYSTKTGRVYNNYYVTGQKATFSNIILRTDNKTVWEKNDDGVWVQIPNIKPIDVFTGSRLNYNHITNKLFYSNGGKIYELKTNYDSSVTINPSTHTITGIDEIKKTNYRIKSGNANNQFNTYGGMVLPHQSWNGEVLMLETKDGNVEGNVARESAGIIISESEGVQVFAPCNGNSRTIFSVYDEDDLVTGNPTPIFSVNDDPGIRCYGALDVTSSVTLENGLYVTGDTYCTGAYYSSSDMRKKDILEEISLDKAYELVNKCQTIFYTWKDDETKKKEIGLIAQEVQQYFPELVSEDKDGYLTLDYSKLTVILLVVIHDLTQKVSKIDTLEEKIKQLENKIQ